MNYIVYIVRCIDKSLYIGVTKDVNKRVWQHNNSKYGARSIKGKRPVNLVYSEKQGSLSEALKREREIKGWNRLKKIMLVKKNMR